MRFLSGRASCGARALLRALFGGAFAVLGLIAGGCGSTIYTYGTPVVTFTSTPGPFTSYLVQVTSIVLTRTDGTVVYPLIIPEIVDFAKISEMPELFGTPALIEGSYVSATITLDYSVATIFTNVNGHSKALTVYDGNATTASTVATTVSYTVKFDPANPLVIKNGVSSPINFNFDLSASSVVDTTALTLTTRPVLTASTQALPPNPLHARGLYVTTDTVNSNFTINSRAFFDLNSSPVGAVALQTDANTTYNINGTSYTGAAGLAAISALPINSLVEAYGSMGSGDLNAVKPTFHATQVYAGASVENLSLYHATGTVTARSGNVLTINGAEVEEPLQGTTTGVAVLFYDSLTVNLGTSTVVAVDGQPGIVNPTIGLISVGQQIDVEGNAITTTDSSGNTVFTGVDATAGLVRLVPTTAWGLLTGVQSATSGTTNLLTLGGYQPEIFSFTGTSADPGDYAIDNTSSTDLTTIKDSPPLVRFDGLVTPFGSASPPDFVASTVTPASSTEQLLLVDWINGGSAAPFTAVDSTGITVNISDPNLGTSAFIQTGPAYLSTTYTTIDLLSPKINPKIVPDTTVTGQFTIGNSSATGYTGFNSYSGFQTQIGTVLNGTNKIQKLVAVGRWDGTNFTAHRIDIVQLP